MSHECIYGQSMSTWNDEDTYRRPHDPLVFMGWDEESVVSTATDESPQTRSSSQGIKDLTTQNLSEWTSPLVLGTNSCETPSDNNAPLVQSTESPDTYFMEWGEIDEDSEAQNEGIISLFVNGLGSAMYGLHRSLPATDEAPDVEDEAEGMQQGLSPPPSPSATPASTLRVYEAVTRLVMSSSSADLLGGPQAGLFSSLEGVSRNVYNLSGDANDQSPPSKQANKNTRPTIKVVNAFGASLRGPLHFSVEQDRIMLANDDKETEFSARTSFTADSPYYTSYVQHEMRQVAVLSDTLRDISARSKTFGKCGALMAEATRRLALACRLKPSNSSQQDDDEGKSDIDPQDKIIRERQEAVGQEMMVVLSTLGEVLDEIADAQVQMCESLEASLSHTLEAFCGTQVTEVTQLQAEAEQMTDSAEQSFAKYLNGRQYASDDNIGSWNKLSEQVSSGFSKTWRESGELPKFKQWRTPAKGDKKINDPNVALATTAANLRLTLEQIRLAQTSAELKRFQLLQKLVSIKKRRNFDLGESALASLHGIRAYFHHCSDMVEGLSPRLARIQQTQTESRERHIAAREPWQAREQGLVKAMDYVGQSVAHAASLADMVASGEIVSHASPGITLNQLEEETQIWDLPTMLAESSRYQREPAPGVFVEGWLYKKSSSRMSLQQWSKRWFMMDKDGIYYFRSSPDTKKASPSGYLHTLERVKICDIVLCTVREINTDGFRFCFEIVTPNQKPLLLQARGPQEFKMWVDGIRSSIETQLTHGDHDASQLMKGIGKQKKAKKRDTSNGNVSDSVTTLASMLQAETVTSRSASHSARQSSDEENDEDDHDWRDVSAEADFRNTQSKPRNPLAEDIMSLNPTCADCGMEKPDWASINLGVLVCIECSGVHRSLGVHVSKVRSLKLDSLSDSEGRLLLALGNNNVNPIWESGIALQQGWKKPARNGSRQIKENWIKSKYVWKGFLQDHLKGKTAEEKALYYNKALFEAARTANIVGLAEALAYSGSVEWRNPDEEGKTALHICSLSHPAENHDTWAGIECAELLLQNGAKMDTMDNNTQGVLDCAVIGNGEREMVEFLSARLQSASRQL